MMFEWNVVLFTEQTVGRRRELRSQPVHMEKLLQGYACRKFIHRITERFQMFWFFNWLSE